MLFRKATSLLSLACLLLWIGLLLFGLWPLNFFPRNKVSWLRSGRGVHFERYGQVYSEAPLSFDGSQVNESTPISIEFWVTPEAGYQSFSAVLCLCDSSPGSDLMIAQSGDDLVLIGLFLDRNGNSAVRHLWFDGAARLAEPRLVTIISSANGTALYLEGKEQRPHQYRDLLPALYPRRLLLGHSRSADGLWSGDILGLAFYDRALRPSEVLAHYHDWLAGSTQALDGARALYTFDEGGGPVVHNDAPSTASDLLIPPRLKRFRPRILEFPHPFRRSDLEDTAVNILGFLPFGTLSTMYLRAVKGFSRRNSLLLSVVSGALTSLLIEISQVLLPTRDSSALDLINNVVGTVAGSALVLVIRGRLSRFLEGM
jgi:VanZ family protein